ncbi:MAG: phosphoribosyltransferase family protein [Erythrobacter sp.]|uniref:phosphoribosyltransferase n=1 Tax=Erythrobacter sp. TaxID=1042 RepID=UPI00262AA183|nr:phosphoribosyltransferase family protein [Erythrobacter sp.]MDJ0977567.1 phosphoribosyltransferase family protein [Erythrobacter sp.]
MKKFSHAFANRTTAGLALAREVAVLDLADPVVLALPRGGVPVAYEIAKELSAPLDLVMVQKLGAPGHAEFAIGALVDGEDPEVMIDDEAAAASGASESYITRLVAESLKEIRRRRSAYGLDWPLELSGRTAVLVDDGIATGSTAEVALRAVKKAGANQVVLAAPVGALEALTRLADLCDQVICLQKPQPFYAVGAHYEDFGQTSDTEVVRYLELARNGASQSGE